MSLIVPKQVRDEAWGFARDTVERAMDGLFGLVERQILRRQSYAFAHEKAKFHERMAERLPLLHELVGVEWRVRRHQRLAERWGAKAYARNPALAAACRICMPVV